MSIVNTRGAQGTLDAMRATNPARPAPDTPVLLGANGAELARQADVLADHEQRLAALEGAPGPASMVSGSEQS